MAGPRDYVEAPFLQQSSFPDPEPAAGPGVGGMLGASVSVDNEGSIAAIESLREQAQARILAAAPDPSGQVGTQAT
jgi:hypothetical protein